MVLKAWGEANQQSPQLQASIFASLSRTSSHVGAALLRHVALLQSQHGDPNASIWLWRYFGTYAFYAVAAFASISVLFLAALRASGNLFRRCLVRRTAR
jgi:type VI protein secretion system component VasF